VIEIARNEPKVGRGGEVQEFEKGEEDGVGGLSLEGKEGLED
jgi:hypothetical protein